jgi:hypothetical protein
VRYFVPEDVNGHAERAVRAMAMDTLIRACIVTAHGKLNPNSSTRAFASGRWGSEEAHNVENVLKAASAPAATSTVGWAKELSPIVVAFLTNLVPMSAGADLLGRALGLSFDGAGQINLPMVTTPLADFVGEGQPIPVVNGVASIQATLVPYKFSVITVLSRELIEHANAEPLVRNALLQSTGPALDRRLFDNVAGSTVRPAGLLYGLTPLTPAATTGGKGEAMTEDLQALLSAVAPVAGNSQIVLICAPGQAVSIKLRTFDSFDYPILVSGALAAGTVIAVATNAIVSASDAAPAIDTTRTASMQFNDSPSGDLMTGGTVIAAFQNDVVGLRLKWPLSWSVRDARGIAFMTGVSW